jgi:hypothetical protein
MLSEKKRKKLWVVKRLAEWFYCYLGAAAEERRGGRRWREIFLSGTMQMINHLICRRSICQGTKKTPTCITLITFGNAMTIEYTPSLVAIFFYI